MPPVIWQTWSPGGILGFMRLLALHLYPGKNTVPGWPCRVDNHQESEHVIEIGVSGAGASPQSAPDDRGIRFLFVGRFSLERYAIRTAGLCEVAPGRPQCTADWSEPDPRVGGGVDCVRPWASRTLWNGTVDAQSRLTSVYF